MQENIHLAFLVIGHAQVAPYEASRVSGTICHIELYNLARTATAAVPPRNPRHQDAWNFVHNQSDLAVN